MIPREHYHSQVSRALGRAPIVALLGPRQCGKTTLAREFLPADAATYFDLEDPVVGRLMENPMSVLQGLRGLVVLDEAQRQPELFPVLRVLADRPDWPVTFLILGSASPSLRRQSAESLAGRVEIIEMQGFGAGEIDGGDWDKLWRRGGFPRSFLAPDEDSSAVWRKNFVSTFLERDLAALGFGMSPVTMGRFWGMLAHYHGQIWNGSEIAASLGIAPNTARSYLEALEQTFLVRRLLPWHANMGKRLVKSPKLYFRDTGLLHTLLGIRTEADLLRHPKLGASWEGFVVESLLRELEPQEAWFYAVHSGSELDLLMCLNGRRIGVEIKRSDAPGITKSMQITLKDAALDALWVIYPGNREYALSEKIIVRPLANCLRASAGTDAKPL